MQVKLFDKYVNLRFYTNQTLNTVGASGTLVRSLITPDGGRKPSIRLSGKWVTSVDIQTVEVRVTNMQVDQPLSVYGTLDDPGYISIEAGYKNGLNTTIVGQVQNSFQETPGPDGVTVFQLLMGHFWNWVTKIMSVNYLKDQPLVGVLQDVCTTLGVNLEYSANLSPALKLPHGLNHNGLAKDLLYRLVQMFWSYDSGGVFNGLRLLPVGSTLLACPGDHGTGMVHQLDYISHARHMASGFDIQAPWVPSIRPMDTVRVDPRYFRQDLGGSLVQAGNLFTVYSIQFEFAVDDDTNMMTLMTVGAA